MSEKQIWLQDHDKITSDVDQYKTCNASLNNKMK